MSDLSGVSRNLERRTFLSGAAWSAGAEGRKLHQQGAEIVTALLHYIHMLWQVYESVNYIRETVSISYIKV